MSPPDLSFSLLRTLPFYKQFPHRKSFIIWMFWQESHKRARKEKREPLDEDQLFVVDLARDLSRVCQVRLHSWNQKLVWPKTIIVSCKPSFCWTAESHSWGFVFTSLPTYHQPRVSFSCLSVLPLQRSAVLEHIWNLDDTWPSSLCRAFVLQWASMLESKVLIWENHPFPEESTGTEYKSLKV